ncbi:MAG: hypothetical protein QW156_04495 [Candidatus Aenigmatarchaeota archaeon]
MAIIFRRLILDETTINLILKELLNKGNPFEFIAICKVNDLSNFLKKVKEKNL